MSSRIDQACLDPRGQSAEQLRDLARHSSVIVVFGPLGRGVVELLAAPLSTALATGTSIYVMVPAAALGWESEPNVVRVVQDLLALAAVLTGHDLELLSATEASMRNFDPQRESAWSPTWFGYPHAIELIRRYGGRVQTVPRNAQSAKLSNATNRAWAQDETSTHWSVGAGRIHLLAVLPRREAEAVEHAVRIASHAQGVRAPRASQEEEPVPPVSPRSLPTAPVNAKRSSFAPATGVFDAHWEFDFRRIRSTVTIPSVGAVLLSRLGVHVLRLLYENLGRDVETSEIVKSIASGGWKPCKSDSSRVSQTISRLRKRLRETPELGADWTTQHLVSTPDGYTLRK